MAETRPGRLTIGIAQLLLVFGATAVWTASRLPWVVVRAFDGLGPPKSVTLSGASWSTALLPMAVLQLATAIAALAVRGWALRALAVLSAMASLAVGYLAISLWVVPDVAARGADLAHLPVMTLVGSERHYAGAVAALVGAVCAVVAAGLLMRVASICAPADTATTTKYAAPAARRAKAAQRADETQTQMSERMMWDALDEGRDPTDRPRDSDTGVNTEGR